MTMKTMKLGQEHIQEVLNFRHAMVDESGFAQSMADDWRSVVGAVYADMYARGTGAHFGAFEDGQLVATAGCIIKNDFPYSASKARRLGWIMDVYVKPAHRKKGLARQLTQAVVDWLASNNITIIKLGTSKQARDYKLYEKLGFEPSNEMVLRRPPV
jgi:GNAT superfamily N-acetyltransferase